MLEVEERAVEATAEAAMVAGAPVEVESVAVVMEAVVLGVEGQVGATSASEAMVGAVGGLWACFLERAAVALAADQRAAAA